SHDERSLSDEDPITHRRPQGEGARTRGSVTRRYGGRLEPRHTPSRLRFARQRDERRGQDGRETNCCAIFAHSPFLPQGWMKTTVPVRGRATECHPMGSCGSVHQKSRRASSGDKLTHPWLFGWPNLSCQYAP